MCCRCTLWFRILKRQIVRYNIFIDLLYLLNIFIGLSEIKLCLKNYCNIKQYKPYVITIRYGYPSRRYLSYWKTCMIILFLSYDSNNVEFS